MNSDLQLLCILTSQTESQILCGLLQSKGIDAHLRGAKEYAGLVTGLDLGRYEILVPPDDLELAQKILNHSNKKSMLHLVEETSTKYKIGSFSDPNFLKLGIVCLALGAVVLIASLVFNFNSLIAIRGGLGLGGLIILAYFIARRNKSL